MANVFSDYHQDNRRHSQEQQHDEYDKDRGTRAWYYCGNHYANKQQHNVVRQWSNAKHDEQ
jgi:hypothetical protein